MNTDQPTFLTGLFAEDGDTITIPATPQGDGRASWSQGWTVTNETPIRAGGVPPHRKDFNSIFSRLSEFAFFAQKGGLFAWDDSQDYGKNCLVTHNNLVYKSLQNSGPSSDNGAKNPTNADYWQIAIITPSATFTVDQTTGEATVPAATETVAGIIKLATEALALAGTDDETAMTPALVKSATVAMENYRKSRIGAVHYMAGASLPAGFLRADGSLARFDDYPELYEAYTDGKLLVTTQEYSTSHPLYFVLQGTTGLYVPRLTGLFARGWVGTASGTIGGYNAAGLPNITGTFTTIGRATGSGSTSLVMGVDGAFSGVSSTSDSSYGVDATHNYGTHSRVWFNAGLSHSIFGSSPTVTPPSYNQPIAIYLGQPA